MPDVGNLDIYQGDDYAATILVTDAVGNPVNLTGYLIQSQIRVGPADSNPTVSVEITCTFTAPNQITIKIPHTTTKLLTGRYVWDLQLTATDGTVTTIIAGAVSVTPEVTREGSLMALMPGYQRAGIFRATRYVPLPQPAFAQLKEG